MNCLWEKVDPESGEFVTRCGGTFVFDSGGPFENGHTRCPTCHRPISLAQVWEAPSDGPGEEDGPWAPGWDQRAGTLYGLLMQRIEALTATDPPADSPDGIRLVELASLCEQYEKRRYSLVPREDHGNQT